MSHEPKIEIVEVTPDLARQWLGRNEGNRNVRQHQVNAYARDMREGRWQFNGDSIRIATDGTMMDGQHRLLACIKADRPFRTLVISGLPREAQDTMDAGAKRSAADQLKRRGVPNFALVAAVALKMIHWDTHGQRRSFTNITVTNAEIVEYCADQKFLDTLSLCIGYIRAIKAPPAVVGTCFCIFARIDLDAAIDFFDGMASGANLNPGNPILVLRERLSDLREQTGLTLNSERYIALFCRAWNHWRAGKKITIVKLPREDEAYPEPR